MTATAIEPSAWASDLRPLLLSLRPRFAEAILDGTKTVELRRTRLSAPDGTHLILYASSPVMAVVGTAVLVGRDTDTPARIWRRHRKNSGLLRHEYDEYFAGADLATALHVGFPHRLADPWPLSVLRGTAKFQPPQSYRFVSDDDPAQLRSLVDAGSSRR
ncbi:ASCH domain-containing protein [Lentzea albidocapillata]|uniref:ASCH domain-containing protein n=1 Tax=Lentzea albidocapillata TaxID=40571 RepID=UPI001B809EFF|nr:ASCH domain-containing protein [Lentzea albidocapillata]